MLAGHMKTLIQMEIKENLRAEIYPAGKRIEFNEPKFEQVAKKLFEWMYGLPGDVEVTQQHAELVLFDRFFEVGIYPSSTNFKVLGRMIAQLIEIFQKTSNQALFFPVNQFFLERSRERVLLLKGRYLQACGGLI